MTKVVFGAALKSTQLPEGIMGLGFGSGVNLQYNNFVDTLFERLSAFKTTPQSG